MRVPGPSSLTPGTEATFLDALLTARLAPPPGGMEERLEAQRAIGLVALRSRLALMLWALPDFPDVGHPACPPGAHPARVLSHVGELTVAGARPGEHAAWEWLDSLKAPPSKALQRYARDRRHSKSVVQLLEGCFLTSGRQLTWSSVVNELAEGLQNALTAAEDVRGEHWSSDDTGRRDRRASTAALQPHIPSRDGPAKDVLRDLCQRLARGETPPMPPLTDADLLMLAMSPVPEVRELTLHFSIEGAPLPGSTHCAKPKHTVRRTTR